MVQESSSILTQISICLAVFLMNQNSGLGFIFVTSRIGQVMVKTFLISPEIVHFKLLSSLGKHKVTESVLHSPEAQAEDGTA